MRHTRPTVRTFVFVFVSLLLLLALTVEVAKYDLGRWNFAVATLIATTKALLIVLFFMHARDSATLTRLVISAGFIWLAIMFVLTFADYATRSWPPAL